MKELLEDKLPSLAQHLDSFGIDVAMVTFNWCLTVFVDAVPTDVRVFPSAFLLMVQIMCVCVCIHALHQRSIKIARHGDGVKQRNVLFENCVKFPSCLPSVIDQGPNRRSSGTLPSAKCLLFLVMHACLARRVLEGIA